ncbi:MAG: hypothetical protein WKF37_22855, partial [Bryobacteraceae bacterium]
AAKIRGDPGRVRILRVHFLENPAAVNGSVPTTFNGNVVERLCLPITLRRFSCQRDWQQGANQTYPFLHKVSDAWSASM